MDRPNPTGGLLPKIPLEPGDRETLRSLEQHVAEHLDGDLSLAALARRAGMSTSCFSRWFRERSGITPHAFVVAARVERAKALLRTTERSLLDVALAVGFTSQSCLTVAFRRHAGMTPTQYRSKVSTKTKDVPARAVRRSSPPPRARANVKG